MGFEVIMALVFSGAALLYTIYRDKSSDNINLLDRLSELESLVMGHTTDIARLNADQTELEDTIRNLQNQIHKLDLKIERILTILEQNAKEKGL